MDLPELEPDERAMLQRFRTVSSPDGATQARVLAAVQLRIAPALPDADGGEVIALPRAAMLSKVLPMLRAGGLAVAIAAATLLVIGGTSRVLMSARGEQSGASQAIDHVQPATPQAVAPPTVAPAVPSEPALPPADAMTATPLPELSPPAAITPATGTAKPKSRASTRGAATPREAAPSPIDAAAEIALVQAAKRETDAAQRLALLERHHREFTRGALAQEVAILEIQTLCALGRRDQASSKAEGFLRRWPGSAYGAAASRGCDAKAGPG